MISTCSILGDADNVSCFKYDDLKDMSTYLTRHYNVNVPNFNNKHALYNFISPHINGVTSCKNEDCWTEHNIGDNFKERFVPMYPNLGIKNLELG